MFVLSFVDGGSCLSTVLVRHVCVPIVRSLASTVLTYVPCIESFHTTKVKGFRLTAQSDGRRPIIRCNRQTSISARESGGV